MVSATNRGDGLPICERLTATRPRSGRPYKSDAREFINPDGPEAADIIEGLVKAAQELLDMIEAQGRAHTPAPKRESFDDANSRDEHDQVFSDSIVRMGTALSLARGEVTHG